MNSGKERLSSLGDLGIECRMDEKGENFFSYPRNRPWRPIGLWDVKDPTLSDNRLTVKCEILATCSSTYSPVRTS
jgi:hypothetical protein